VTATVVPPERTNVGGVVTNGANVSTPSKPDVAITAQFETVKSGGSEKLTRPSAGHGFFVVNVNVMFAVAPGCVFDSDTVPSSM